MAVAALGMTVVIISGGIDLSAGTALALASTVIAYCLREDWGIGLSISAGLLTGCLAGLLNGVLVSVLRVVPFIVTLGTMTIYRGLAKIVADNTTVHPDVKNIPGWLSNLVSPCFDHPWIIPGVLPNFAAAVWLTLGLAVVMACVLRYTVFGRHVFAIGSNESTARLCGINVPWTKIGIYTLSGLFVGIAGLYHFARSRIGDPTSGDGRELQIIAAVVIGGGSLSGGRGTVLGTLTGAAIMAVMSNGSAQLGLGNPMQDIIIGAIIIAAATLDQIRHRQSAAA